MFTRKPTTNNAPVILLKYNVEVIAGMRLINCSWFCFSLWPDFIMSGIVAKIIKHERGKISKFLNLIMEKTHVQIVMLN